jgi:hypothetical protein
MTPGVCNLASLLAPDKPPRTLDALHLARFLMARTRIEGLELLTADRRLEEAARLASWSEGARARTLGQHHPSGARYP